MKFYKCIGISMQINYWNEIELLSQASLITVISIAILLCFTASLINFAKFYRDEKRLKVRTPLIQIFILSILTAILICVKNSLATAATYRNAKIESILTKYWHDRESSAHFWNTLQSTYKCCGVNGNMDWEPEVPMACYQSQSNWLFWEKSISYPLSHDRGCYGVIVAYFNEMTCWFEFIGTAFILLGSFSIFGMILTLVLNLMFHQKRPSAKSLSL